MRNSVNYISDLLIVIFLLFGLMGCKPNPQDDINLFKSFIANNINKVSDDPFISSTVRPGNELFQPLLNIQNGKMDIAYEQLSVLVEKDNVEAKFWLAKMIYQASIKSISRSIHLYNESANQGNPYAYYELSPLGNGCLDYFGKEVCTDENLNKAIDIFRDLARNGDLRSQYFLLKNDRVDKSKNRDKYISEIIRFSEGHYYKPLMDYVNTILFVGSNGREYTYRSKDDYDLAISLLTIASNNNYIPAIEILILLNKGISIRDNLYSRLKKLGGIYYIESIFYNYKDDFDNDELSCYASVYKTITGSAKFFLWIDSKIDANKKLFGICSVDRIINSMTPMIYIDAFTNRDQWAN